MADLIQEATAAAPAERPAHVRMVNGTPVRMRTRFPAKENWDLPGMLMTFARQDEGGFDLQRIVPVLPRLIEGWGFDGLDPREAESYGELDLFREVIPLVKEVAAYLGELMRGQGEAGSAST